MITLSEVILNSSCSLREALEKINKSGLPLLLVTDVNNKFIGVLSEGDIRRAILKNTSIEQSILQYVNQAPLVLRQGENLDAVSAKAKLKGIRYVPEINLNNEVVRLIDLHENKKITRTTPVVLMAGGLGMRLRPITEHIPKPMVEVGGFPILHYVIESLKNHGFSKVILCVNYKSEVIQNYFGKGEKYDIEIDYFKEPEKLGTAGALSYLKAKLTEPFLVMNADIITSVNYAELMDFHIRTQSVLTVGLREYSVNVPFGVVDTDKDFNLLKISEKPQYTYNVSAGIYVLSPQSVESIPHGRFYDMPQLITALQEMAKPVKGYLLNGYWIDIGHLKDLEKANEDLSKVGQNEPE